MVGDSGGVLWWTWMDSGGPIGWNRPDSVRAEGDASPSRKNAAGAATGPPLVPNLSWELPEAKAMECARESRPEVNRSSPEAVVCSSSSMGVPEDEGDVWACLERLWDVLGACLRPWGDCSSEGGRFFEPDVLGEFPGEPSPTARPTATTVRRTSPCLEGETPGVSSSVLGAAEGENARS